MYSYLKGQESQSTNNAKSPADNNDYLMLMMIMIRMVGMLTIMMMMWPMPKSCFHSALSQQTSCRCLEMIQEGNNIDDDDDDNDDDGGDDKYDKEDVANVKSRLPISVNTDDGLHMHMITKPNDDDPDYLDDVVVIDDADDDYNKDCCNAEYNDDDDDFDAKILLPVITADGLHMSGDDGANRKQKNITQM